MSETESGDEVGLRHFLGSAFDHDDFGLVADVHEVEVAVVTLAVGRVHNELTIHPADAHGTDRACEGDVRHAKSGGSAVDGEDVRVVLAVSTEQEGDDLGFVKVSFWEQRTQWAVRHTAGEDFLLSWAAFALEVTARELASCRGFFFVFHGEGEEVESFLDLGGGDGGDDDDGVTQADCHGAIGEVSEFAGFDFDDP